MEAREALIAAARALWGQETETSKRELRFGHHQSKSIDLEKLTFYDHEAEHGGGYVELCGLAGVELPKRNGDGGGPQITYPYRAEDGTHLFDVVRFPGHKFRQRQANGAWNLKGVRRVLYRLPQLIAADVHAYVFVCEGEKDADRLARLGFVATTNPGGAGKWRDEYSRHLAGRHVVILPDNDEPGRAHARQVARSLHGIAASLRVLLLPHLPAKGDVSDWLDSGGSAAQLIEHVSTTAKEQNGGERGTESKTEREPAADPVDGVCDVCGATPCRSPRYCQDCRDARISPSDDTASVDYAHFLAYAPEHKFIFRPTGQLWPQATVNSRLPWKGGIKPSTWLDQNQPVEQMTWAPGEGVLIRDKLIREGGWIEHRGATVYNHYRAPNIRRGDAGKATPWIEHLNALYPNEADHILRWFAHRVQHPDIKINHALVLGGAPGIGKDTLLAPVRMAVGHWNVQNISPIEMLGNFTGFRKAVIVVVSEARDLGDNNRPQFYEHMKILAAAPPDVLRVNEKHQQEYYIPNLIGVILTTNYKAGGIYLAPDDRRHLVAWSTLELDSFAKGYWDTIWGFYDNGGYSDVAALLHEIDLSNWNPKAPPPKTEAFWEIVNAARAPEFVELDDALTLLGRPAIITLDELTSRIDGGFGEHLRDRRNRRMIPRWMEGCGYRIVHNPNARNGVWKYRGKLQMIYGDAAFSNQDLLAKIRGE